MIDYHVHSECSGDCKTPIIDVCRAAIDRGLAEICFTEHIDFEPTDSCYGTFDYALYKSQINSAREAFAGVLSIQCGIEVDFQPKFRSRIRDFFDGKDFDYVIGAAHYVDGVILEDHSRYFPGKTADEAYAPYFDNALAAVETGWFDTLAHLDLCKRYGVRYFGPLNWMPYSHVIEEILKVVISKDMSLEINTSGLRQSPGDTYPSRDILELYYSLGGRRIIVGSDAHKTEDVGAGIPDALAIVQGVGFTHISTYASRRRTELPIIQLMNIRGEAASE